MNQALREAPDLLANRKGWRFEEVFKEEPPPDHPARQAAETLTLSEADEIRAASAKRAEKCKRFTMREDKIARLFVARSSGSKGRRPSQ